jgi:SAM-dependent methyltransferase
MSLPPNQTYGPGHHAAVTMKHIIRTAENSAAFVLPYIKPTSRILDIGCGPGSITVGFAKYVPDGSVTGVDPAPEALRQAQTQLVGQESKQERAGHVNFELGNVLEGLHFEDSTFDVVFCSQTLIYFSEPVKAMQEMKRVCKKGGVVACSEGDPPFHFYPELPGLLVLHKYVWMLIHGPLQSSSSSSEPIHFDPEHPYNAPHPANHRSGSRVHVWARHAGFDPDRMVKGASVQVSATHETRSYLGKSMVARIEEAGHGAKFTQLGASQEDVDAMVTDLKLWMEDDDGWYAAMNCEVLCFV